MKKRNEVIKRNYFYEISKAKANDCEAIILPYDFDCDAYEITSFMEENDIFDIAYEFGWDKFLLINFTTNEETLINLYELEIA